jgi:hypothetical protein
VKIADVGRARKGSVFQLECVPVSVLLTVLLTLLAPALSSALSPTRS